MIAVLLCAWTGVVVNGAAPTPQAAQLLARADDLKTSDYATFTRILRHLVGQGERLSHREADYLRYLRGWDLAYRGQYIAALEKLQETSESAHDLTLRSRADATIVNVLQISSRYEDALLRLNDLLNVLPEIADKRSRQQILGVASLIYSDVRAYALALRYANMYAQEASDAGARCRAQQAKLKALEMAEWSDSLEAQYQYGIDICARADSMLFANAIRTLLVRRMLDAGQSNAAVKALTTHYDEVQQTQYAELISKFDALLAVAYRETGESQNARRHAMRALEAGALDPGTKSFVRAYRVLYLVAKQRDDDAAALAWHEKYMAADSAYLNEVSAKALAFQKVNQQVLAKERQIKALNDENRILGLQQALSEKAAETTRLYVALLIVILAAVALWTWRVKRSQIAFRKQARRDSLTGIFNRQHFMEAAHASLQYGGKSDRESSLVLLDLDHFKSVNDNHGHATGDAVLKRTVAACQQQLQSVDIFGRLGGEEFGVLLPDCRLHEGVARAEQMRLAIVALSSDDAPDVSASFGVATTAISGYKLRELLAHADAALYRAKHCGRNTVTAFDTKPQPTDA